MKIALLLSGGVDSSVALALLKQAGYDVTAFYIKIWMEDKFSHLGKCPWEDDLAYAEKVCDMFDVSLEIIPLQKEYWQRVVKDSIASVGAGLTPNPDIWCNSRVKFGAFYDYVGHNFDRIATGHYARVSASTPFLRRGKDPLYYLKKTQDPIKDQTYFLAGISQSQLSRLMFPIGKYTKEDIRKIARDFDLPNKDRKDSQGICFLGKIKYRDFIREHLGNKPGDIICMDTREKLGEHDGYWYYTIGQRKDIKLPGGPWYVIDKDKAKNIIYVSRENIEDNSRDTFFVRQVNWITDFPRKSNLRVKIRHGAKNYKCRIKKINNHDLLVKISDRDQGVAQGQWAVFYDNDTCLGGGVIDY